MKKLIYIIGVAAVSAAAVVLGSCDDTSTTIGSSLVEDQVEVVMDSSFRLTGGTVRNERVQSRTVTQLIGRLDATEYGRLESSIVTQFMPGLVMDAAQFTADDIDSVRLTLQMSNGAYTGDSLTPMGLKVYPLVKALPSPIYSDFDPAGYYDASQPWGSAIYNATALGQSDSVQALSTRNIMVELPRAFGVKLYEQYVSSPSTFSTPSAFAEWFPGLYIANTYGTGRVTRIDKSYITMFYHVDSVSAATGNDTVYNYANTLLAVTPEIVTNNNIDYTLSPDLEARAAQGQALLVAPAGYDVQVTVPGRELVDYYRANSGPLSVLNALELMIPAEVVSNDYSIAPPSHLLMVRTDKLDEFFAKNLIYDGVTSFYAAYDSTSGTYTFSEMRKWLSQLLSQDEITDEDITFTITPVNLITESSTNSYSGATTTTVTQIVPWVTNPVMARLLLDEAKLTVTFSKQTVDL